MKIILKVLLSIIVLPFAIAGGLIFGLGLLIAMMFGLPIIAVEDIWEK